MLQGPCLQGGLCGAWGPAAWHSAGLWREESCRGTARLHTLRGMHTCPCWENTQPLGPGTVLVDPRAEGGLDPNRQSQGSQDTAGERVRSAVPRELQPSMVQWSAAASAVGLGHQSRRALGWPRVLHPTLLVPSEAVLGAGMSSEPVSASLPPHRLAAGMGDTEGTAMAARCSWCSQPHSMEPPLVWKPLCCGLSPQPFPSLSRAPTWGTASGSSSIWPLPFYS